MSTAPMAEALERDLPVPYTVPDNYQFYYGDPLRGPEPLSTHVELPLPPWDEELAQATVNQGNPFTDYGHFRVKADITFSPWIIATGDGPAQVDATLLGDMLAQFDPPRVIGDGSLMHYTLLQPPTEAAMPEGGWPLVIINPGVGSIGQKGLSATLGDTTQWASPYHRAHYPGYVLRWHPQARVTTPVDRHLTFAEPAYHAAMDFLDRFLDDNPVDRNRIYVMGFSMGGRTTWRNLVDRPDFFAAAVPHSGGGPFPPGDLAGAQQLAHIPLWMMIGNQDPWSGSARYIGVYQDLVAAGAQRVRFWEQQDIGHQDYSLRSFHIPEWLFNYSLRDEFRAAAPSVLLDPQEQSIIEGQPLELQANFMGAPAPTVQWLKDGVPIENANKFFLRIPSVSLDHSGNYSARASNDSGEVATAAAQITVLADVTAPQLVRIGSAGPSQLILEFNEPLLPGDGPNSAEHPENFSLSDNGEVVAAELLSDGVSVRLSINGLVDGQSYQLTIGPIMDQAASPNAATPSVHSFTFLPSLVGHWTMEDATIDATSDQSGRGNAAAFSGRLDKVPGGRPGSALRFTGNANYMEVPMSELRQEAGTVAVWARRIGTGTDRRQSILLTASAAEPSSRLGITITQSTGFISFAFGDQTSIGTGTSLGEQWTHLAIAWEAGTYSVFINGELNTSGEYTAFMPAGDPMLVGNRAIGGQGFAGDVDDLRLYNRALTPSEVAALYVAGSTPPPAQLLYTDLLQGGILRILLQGEPLVSYHLERSTNLGAAAAWETVPETEVVAESAEVTLQTDVSASPTGFFRVMANYLD